MIGPYTADDTKTHVELTSTFDHVQIRRSLWITFLASNFNTLLMFALTLILARLLTPADIGVFSIAVVFINIVAVFRDWGISSYLVRETTLTPEKLRSAIGLYLVLSWALALVLVLVSAPLARYYDQSGVEAVLHVLTVSFLLVPYASVLSSLLARDLQAGKQAVVTGVSTVVYALTCITLALGGHGYLSLAWANLANLMSNIVCLYLLRPVGLSLRPSFFGGWREPLRFGGGAVIGNLVNVMHQSLPDLLLGKFSGVREVGLFSRANGLIGIFQQIAGPALNFATLPYVASERRGGTAMAPLLARANAYLTGLAWPVYVFFAVFAHDLIQWLYGEAWIEAAPVASIIALSAGLRLGYLLFHPALTAMDRPYNAALMVGANLVLRVAVLFIWRPAELMSFAWALCIADLVSMPMLGWVVARWAGLSAADWLRSHLRSMVVTIACALACLLGNWLLPQALPIWLRLAAAAFLFSATWLIGIFAIGHPLKSEIGRAFTIALGSCRS